MERLHLLNRLEQFCHIDWKSFNQLVLLPHLEPIEPITTPIIVPQGVIYSQGTWPIGLVHGQKERSQVPHHKSVSRGNQGVGTITCSYCHQMGHLLNCCPLVDDRLK